MTEQEIHDLRSVGYLVSCKEGQISIEGENFVIEEDFGRWFLYYTDEASYCYMDEFDDFNKAIIYARGELG